MLNLTCPNCGITADETDLHCDGQAHIERHGAGASDDKLEEYLFIFLYLGIKNHTEEL